MSKNIKLLKTLRVLFFIIGLFYLGLTIIQIVYGFANKDKLLTRIHFSYIYNFFFEKTSIGLLCFVISYIFKILITRNLNSLKIIKRILNSCVISFCILGIVNIISDIISYLKFHNILSIGNTWSMYPISFYSSINLILVKMFPIFSAIAIYVIFYSFVDFINFESEVA